MHASLAIGFLIANADFDLVLHRDSLTCPTRGRSDLDELTIADNLEFDLLLALESCKHAMQVVRTRDNSATGRHNPVARRQASLGRRTVGQHLDNLYS